MAVIMIGVGETRLAMVKKDKGGNVVSETPAQWTPNPEGGSVAICQLDPETMEPASDVEIYGDWDAAGYLARALEMLSPKRGINIPDLKAIFKAAAKDGHELCEYCQQMRNCQDCIAQEWKEEA